MRLLPSQHRSIYTHFPRSLSTVNTQTYNPIVTSPDYITASPPQHCTETQASLTITMKERVVFIPPHDYHAALDEYNERWDAVTAHQTSTPLPSVGLKMFGLQSHAFIDAEGAKPIVSSWPRATLLKANAFRFYCKAFGLGVMWSKRKEQ